MTARTRYLLDTSVLSEARRKRADVRVVAFLESTNPTSLYLSCLSLGELKKGVALRLKTDPPVGKAIAAWVNGLEANFSDRIFGIDIAITRLWGEWSAQRRRPVIETLLAATAMVHGLVFVTRNERDVQDLPVKVLNPWH